MHPLKSGFKGVTAARDGEAVGKLPEIVALQLRQRRRIGNGGEIRHEKIRKAEVSRIRREIINAELPRNVLLEGASRDIKDFQTREVEPRLVQPARTRLRIANAGLLGADVFIGRQSRKATGEHAALRIDGVAREQAALIAELVVDSPRARVVVVLIGR